MPRWETLKQERQTHHVTEYSLDKLSAFVATRMGLQFHRAKWDDLKRGLCFAACEFGFEDLEACVQWLVCSHQSTQRIEILASYLTVGETYFLRDKSGFDVLEQSILPDLIHSRRGKDHRLKIWSAGCCTGEEAYSIAIVLDRVIPDLKEWNVDIIATDINPHFLHKACEGVYGEWSFRQTPGWIRESYFRKTKNNKYEILPHIKKMVDFEYLNLAEDVYPSYLNDIYAVDVIFCRNVLMYFVPEQTRKVLSGFYRSLVDGGKLIVSPSDLLHVKISEFTPVDHKYINIYKKDPVDIFPRLELGSSDSISPYEPPKFFESTGSPTVVIQPDTDPIREKVPPQDVTANSLQKTERKGETSCEQAPEDETLYTETLELYRQGHYEETSDKLLELLSSRSGTAKEAHSNTEEMVLLARAYANQGKLDEALEWCDKAIAANKLKPFSHYLRATILQEQKQVEKAVSSLRQAIFLEPEFILSHFSLGNLARLQGKTAESRKHFSNTIHLLDKYPENEILSDSEGLTIGRLKEIITFITETRD